MKIDKKGVEAIIFDFGGVILNLDFDRCLQAFKFLGVEVENFQLSQKEQDPLFDLFEMGKISATQFRAAVKEQCNKEITHAQIDWAWNSMLLDFPQHRFDFLQQIGKKYPIYLLSNTNSIHAAFFTDLLTRQFGENAFHHLFQKVYLSHEMGMRKPNANIFEFVIQENHLNPNTTLFIDDSPQHVAGASTVGVKTHWHQKGEEITQLFADFLT